MKAIIAAAVTALVLAGSADAESLAKRHQLGLKFGMWNQTTDNRTEIGIGGIETSVGNNGAMGGVYYSHWLEENLALTFSIEGTAIDIQTDIDYTGVETATSSVGTMLMGVKYYFAPSTLEGSVRPYFKGGIGPFYGEQSSSRAGLTVVTEKRTSTAFGGQLGIGVDFIAGRHFMLGLSTGFNVMSDFDQSIGGSKNYGGPIFGFEFSWLFGKGVE